MEYLDDSGGGLVNSMRFPSPYPPLLQPVLTTQTRVACIGWMRGLVMVLMVVDHAAMAFNRYLRYSRLKARHAFNTTVKSLRADAAVQTRR